jgi:hypothetical protein
MGWIVTKTLIAGLTVAAVSEVGARWPRLGAVILTLPIVSILAFVATWLQARDLPAVSRLARETLILVPLGLPFFVPLAFAKPLGLGFWPALGAGLAAATATIGAWLWLTAPAG